MFCEIHYRRTVLVETCFKGFDWEIRPSINDDILVGIGRRQSLNGGGTLSKRFRKKVGQFSSVEVYIEP